MYAGAATIGVEDKARARGIPMAVALSLALHGLGLVGFLRMSMTPAEEPLTVIENVDLMVQEEEKKAEPARPKAPPPSMKDFLKLALPSVPKPMAAPMEAKAPLEEKRLLDMTPKLEDKGRVKEPQKLEALDLGRKRPDLAKLSAAPLEERRSRTLEALPKLEEVGSRQAPRKTLQLAQLAEDRGRVQMRRVDALGSLAAERRKAPAAAPMLEAEAATGRSPSMSRLADMLTSEKLEQPQPRAISAPTQPRISAMADTPAPPPARKAEVREVKKKAVEIEGPLSNRRVVRHSLPSFPEWARDLGLVEAEVQIRFYVAADGAVVPENMRVERTAGYGRLDRLAMQHLKAWRFEPKPGAGNEWGLITFRFVLE